MKKAYLLACSSALLILASCGGKSETAGGTDSVAVQTQETAQEAEDLSAYEVDWNKPTIGTPASTFNTYFGMIDPKETDDANADMQPMPPIKGLYHNSCMFSCPEDGCFRKRDILALRCPDVAKLKQWMCVRAHAFAEDCSNGEECVSHSRIPQNKNLESAKEICDFYVAKTEEAISQYECKGSEGDFVPLEQHGMLITDVWKRGDLYTFFISSWYDWMSCGDNTRRTYVTVDSKTGKGIGLNDIFEAKDQKKFADLMMKSFDHKPSEVHDALAALKESDGIALIREGVIVSFFPYHIGCGAEGQFFSIVSYDELEKAGIALKCCK